MDNSNYYDQQSEQYYEQNTNYEQNSYNDQEFNAESHYGNEYVNQYREPVQYDRESVQSGATEEYIQEEDMYRVCGMKFWRL